MFIAYVTLKEMMEEIALTNIRYSKKNIELTFLEY
jgi:hypothetical protein